MRPKFTAESIFKQEHKDPNIPENEMLLVGSNEILN